jgi:hypothetical protein
MKKQQYKTKIFTAILTVIITLSAISFALPVVTAQSNVATYPFIGAIPNPVGVNQEVLLHVGIPDYLMATSEGWEGLTVTVTRPDGETENLGPYRTDSTGGTGDVYVPTMTGTYTFVTNFPEQDYNNVTYLESSSAPLELVVQEERVEYYPSFSLPNEYWSRPIDAQFREWYSISGNWLWGTGLSSGIDQPNSYAPYNDGPETAHILWTKKLTTGGLVGGALYDHAYEDGDAYEGLWSNSIILNGILYYNKYKSGYPIQEVVAVDVHTGEEQWCKTVGDNERIAFGQTFYWTSYNYHGAFDYIWTTISGPSGTTWKAYDPTNGVFVYGMENVPSGTTLIGPKGELYKYTVNLANGWMTLWNSSRVVSDSGSWMGGFMGSGYGMYDAMDGIEWNKTIPTGLPGSVAEYYFEDRILGTTACIGPASEKNNDITTWAISLKPGEEGTLLFQKTWTAPDTDVIYRWSTASIEDGVFVLSSKETVTHYGLDIETGNLLWSTEPQGYMDMWAKYGFINDGVNIAYNKLFSVGYDGIVYCYDIDDGSLVWSYTATDEYSEILWSNNWPLWTVFITDGKIYLGHTEHSSIDPKARGAPFICLDVETGDVVFKIEGAFRQTHWGGQALIGDSIITTMNTYDQQIYAIGKGATSISLSAPVAGVTVGSPCTLIGSVMDVSPGTKEADILIRFPDGVPAISDNDMSEWMKHVYMQFQKPADAKGVTVIFCGIKPNGEYMDIGRTTTDSSGNYGYTFKPEMEGKYTIIATFEGSGGYYGSTTTTYMSVGPASTPATPIDNEPVDNNEPVVTETPFISTELAIIAAVAIAAVIGVAAYWILKHK